MVKKTESFDLKSLYDGYKKTSDDDIRKYLETVKLVKVENKGIGTVHGYYELSKNALAKINGKPRGISLTFDAADASNNLIEGLKVYKQIVFLVKSSSRFFLKPDIGEVFDAITPSDLTENKIFAISVDADTYETLADTGGEHFLMIATLLTKAN